MLCSTLNFSKTIPEPKVVMFLRGNLQFNSCSQQLQPNQLQSSSDRGTPLVCNNRLSGLLSQILPPQNISTPAASCETTLKTWAFYTKVSNHTAWIHQTISRQQPAPGPGHIPSAQPIATPPPYFSKCCFEI